MERDLKLTSDELAHFLCSDEVQAIREHVTSFNAFRALGIEKREISHSNLLAYFLDPRKPHGCGDAALRSFCRSMLQRSTADSAGLRLNDYLSLRYDNASIAREQCFGDSIVDIIVDFPTSKSVIAIENKIYAGEQSDQISRYQNCLKSNYAHYASRTVVFLTPTGRPPATAETEDCLNPKDPRCPCISLSYKAVLEALAAAKSKASPEVGSFLSATIEHIKEDIMENSGMRSLVRDVLKNREYAEIILKLDEYRPKLASVQKEFLRQAREVVRGMKTEIVNEETLGGSRGSELKEIKFQIKSWNDKGIYFTVVFYHYSYFPALRVLIFDDEYAKNPAVYQRLAQISAGDATSAKSIDQRYPRISDWTCFRRVFEEDDYPEESYIFDLSFSEQTVAKAVELLKRDISLLNTWIDRLK